MKNRANWLLIPAVVVSLGACKKKEEVKAPEAAAAAVVEAAKEAGLPVPSAPTAKVSVEERAAKLGFAKHLPQDTEVVLAVYNGTKISERAQGTKLWKLIAAEMGGGMGRGFGQGIEDADDEDLEIPEVEQEDKEPLDAGAEPVGAAAFLGTEVTLAMGKTTGEQLGNLMNVSRRMSYFQMRGLAKSFVKMVKSGELDGLAEAYADSLGPQVMKDLLNDTESGITSIEKAKMPPIYMAFRTSSAQRSQVAQTIAASVENMNMFLGPMVEPAKIEAGGSTFEGVKIVGSKVAATMAEQRESMEKEMDAAKVDRLIAAIGKKDLVLVSGTVGDYVLLFIGGSADELKLANSPTDSLVGGNALAFGDAYLSKDLAAISYGQKEAMDLVIKSAGGFADVTNGLRDGLSGANGLGDTRDLEALFQLVAERETALRKLTTVDAAGMVAFFEQGLKIDSFGGNDYGMLDFKTPNKLAALGDSEDVVLFADFSVDADYDQKSHDFIEALMETSYALAMKVAEVQSDEGEMAQFKGMAKMFDEKFRPDLVALWDAFNNDFGSSLGGESALIVDLKGAAPAIPGIAQGIVDKAKVPRISVIAPVTDRAKLSGSWDKMNVTLTGTLAKISEMTGAEIPMQKPLSSEKNGNITWFFPMPFFTDDFLPSVTVGDKWFVASSSKLQALDLISKADAASEARTGLVFSMNFKTLQAYLKDTSKLVGDNAEAITGAPLEAEQKSQISSGIAALDELDKLTVHSRREGAVVKTSIHFKTR